MNRLLKLLLLLVLSAPCAAQDTAYPAENRTAPIDFEKPGTEPGRLSVSIMAGLNYSGLYGKDLAYVFGTGPAGNKTGYHIGLVLDHNITAHFGLKHALLFNHIQAGLTLIDSINSPYNSVLKMSYLELQPANITYRFKGLQVYAGPYLSALLRAAIDRKDEQGRYFNDKSIYGTPGDNESKDKYLQKFDCGLHAGLAYRFDFGLSLSAGYSLGLADIIQYANSYTLGDNRNDNIRLYNRGCRLSIGYTFR